MNKEKNRRKSKDENNKINLNEEDNFNLKFNTKIEEKNKGYDIVIDIRSFKSLIFNGWRIKFPNGNELKTYEKKKNNETIVVGVIGNGNKGKSFTLQKLSEYKIPKGFSLATEGLSIKYSDLKEKNICILDSAGREGPLIKMVLMKIRMKMTMKLMLIMMKKKMLKKKKLLKIIIIMLLIIEIINM